MRPASSRTLACAAVLVGGALAAGVWHSLRDEAPSHDPASRASSSPGVAGLPNSADHDAPSQETPAAPSLTTPILATRSTSTPQRILPAPEPAPDPERHTNPGGGGAERVAERSRLEQSARLVQEEADRELARLVPLLGLNDRQQDRVFAILAGTSAHFDPVMGIATGSTAGHLDGKALTPADSAATRALAREEAIHQILDLDQQLAYEEYLADRDAWWSEFLEREEAELDALVAETLATSNPATPIEPENSAASPGPLPEIEQHPAKKNPSDVTAPTGLPSPTSKGQTPAPSGALPF